MSSLKPLARICSKIFEVHDHDDYAALIVAPFLHQAGAPPPGNEPEVSADCPPPPSKP